MPQAFGNLLYYAMLCYAILSPRAAQLVSMHSVAQQSKWEHTVRRARCPGRSVLLLRRATTPCYRSYYYAVLLLRRATVAWQGQAPRHGRHAASACGVVCRLSPAAPGVLQHRAHGQRHPAYRVRA